MKHLNELIVSSPRVIPRAMAYVNGYRNNMKGKNTNWTLQLLCNYFSTYFFFYKWVHHPDVRSRSFVASVDKFVPKYHINWRTYPLKPFKDFNQITIAPSTGYNAQFTQLSLPGILLPSSCSSRSQSAGVYLMDPIEHLMFIAYIYCP